MNVDIQYYREYYEKKIESYSQLLNEQTEALNKQSDELIRCRKSYDDAICSIKVLKRQMDGLFERETSALHTLEMCKDEIDLLNHILSINKIQLTPDVVQDAQIHLRELTKEMIE